MKKKRVLCAIGTRPEVIKMAPVIEELKRRGTLDVQILSTAQQRNMVDQMAACFQIVPDIDLDVMAPDQTLPELTTRLLPLLDQTLEREKPDFVLSQGDTMTAMLTSLASFYRKVPFGHVEAGLRTYDFASPFPEEMNRALISRMASLHFAPTEQARNNLLKEGHKDPTILVTGNTVIDALLSVLARRLEIDPRINPNGRLLLVTSHRRENHGEPLVNICRSLRLILDRYPDVQILYPVHPNPHVKEVVTHHLGQHPRVLLTEPLSYDLFVTTMSRSYLVLSDSGGIQEEAPALGIPVLVLRNTTERSEAIQAGVARLVGTNPETIVGSASALLDDLKTYQTMAQGQKLLFGDGRAASKIASAVESFLYRSLLT